ncbi:MAG: hypothetical protein K6B28_10575, partial [Lachnospiraceae bacterium]|nr:hypothetical protein [Lachnospiraceae bacterium]
YYGGILGLSHESAILDTGLDMEIYDNIQMDAGGKLFCKVMEKSEAGYTVIFTSIPTGYPAWLRSARTDKA